MITKENSPDRYGAASIEPVWTNSRTNGHCNICGQNLIEIPFYRQLRIAHACNNIFCILYRSPLFYTEIPADQISEPKVKNYAYRSPTRVIYLRQMRENYRLLVSLGVPSVEAAKLKYNRKMAEYLKSIGDKRYKNYQHNRE